jgi:hypothetical protein
VTDGVSATNTTVTSVTGGFTSAMIGNLVYLAGGTATLPATRRIIAAVPNGNTLTLDAALPSTGTGITVRVGGALLTLAACFNTTQATGTASQSGTTLTIATTTYGEWKVGTVIAGTGFGANTVIIADNAVNSALTGTGGNGTYTVSISQTVGAGTATTGSGSVTTENTIYAKAGTYTVTTAAAATVYLCGSPVANCKLISYDTNRTEDNTDTNRALFTSVTNGVSAFITCGGSFLQIINAKFTQNSSSKASVIQNAGTRTYNLVLINCLLDTGTVGVFSNTSSASSVDVVCYGCTITNMTSAAFQMAASQQQLDLDTCYVYGNARGVYLSGAANTNILVRVRNSVIANNTGRGIDTVAQTTGTVILRISHTIFYKNATANIEIGGTAVTPSPTTGWFFNNVIYGSTDGFKVAQAANANQGFNFNGYNSFGGQSGSARVNFETGESDLTLTADPFLDGANNDFRLNNTDGGGKVLRDAGWPRYFQGDGAASLNLLDAGAFQAQDMELVKAWLN